MRAKIVVVYDEPDFIYIEDLAEKYQCMSVTNDAEAVVDFLHKSIGIKNRIIYYRDTMNRVDILMHKDGVFTNFAPGFDSFEEFIVQKGRKKHGTS